MKEVYFWVACACLYSPGHNKPIPLLRSKLLIFTAPRLGGITIINQVAPIKADGAMFTMQISLPVDIAIPVYKKFTTKTSRFDKEQVSVTRAYALFNAKNISSTSPFITVLLLASYSISAIRN